MTQDRPANEAGVVTKLSPRPVADTTARLTGMISAKGMKLFAVIDQAAEPDPPGSQDGGMRLQIPHRLRPQRSGLHSVEPALNRLHRYVTEFTLHVTVMRFALQPQAPLIQNALNCVNIATDHLRPPSAHETPQ
jgi:hypothetical protein